MRTCLPSVSSANASESWDPIESPSGRACEVSRIRRRFSSSSRIWRRTDSVAVAVVVFWLIVLRVLPSPGDFLQELFDAIAARHGLVVEELELGHALEAHPAADLAA